jgi:hypothetical protein
MVVQYDEYFEWLKGQIIKPRAEIFFGENPEYAYTPPRKVHSMTYKGLELLIGKNCIVGSHMENGEPYLRVGYLNGVLLRPNESLDAMDKRHMMVFEASKPISGKCVLPIVAHVVTVNDELLVFYGAAADKHLRDRKTVPSSRELQFT